MFPFGSRKNPVEPFNGVFYYQVVGVATRHRFISGVASPLPVRSKTSSEAGRASDRISLFRFEENMALPKEGASRAFVFEVDCMTDAQWWATFVEREKARSATRNAGRNKLDSYSDWVLQQKGREVYWEHGRVCNSTQCRGHSLQRTAPAEPHARDASRTPPDSGQRVELRQAQLF